jgi:hypothetical protein
MAWPTLCGGLFRLHTSAHVCHGAVDGSWGLSVIFLAREIAMALQMMFSRQASVVLNQQLVDLRRIKGVLDSDFEARPGCHGLFQQPAGDI